MNKKEIKKKYGLSDENFVFYVEMGQILKVSNNEYKPIDGFDDQILEKSTVFRYFYEDDFNEIIKDFSNFVKYTSKVKKYTKEEIKAFEDKKKGRN